MTALQENIKLIEEQNELFKELIVLRITLDEQNKKEKVLREKITEMKQLMIEHDINPDTGEKNPNIVID